MGWTLTTEPATEPVTLAQAKAQIRIDHDSEDDFLNLLIEAARQMLERDTQTQLVTATWTLTRDRLPAWPSKSDRLTLPKAPLQSVTSVKYVDTDGTLQTFAAANYHVNTDCRPPEIVLADGASWPADIDSGRPDALQVLGVFGFGDAADVPAFAKLAILLLVGHWFNNREAVLVGTVSKEIEIAYQRLAESLAWTRLHSGVHV